MEFLYGMLVGLGCGLAVALVVALVIKNNLKEVLAIKADLESRLDILTKAAGDAKKAVK